MIYSSRVGADAAYLLDPATHAKFDRSTQSKYLHNLKTSTYRRSIRKDKKGNIVIVDVDDPRIQSEGLVGASKYIAVMKDTHGNVVRVPINDPRIASGELRKLKNLI